MASWLAGINNIDNHFSETTETGYILLDATSHCLLLMVFFLRFPSNNSTYD